MLLGEALNHPMSNNEDDTLTDSQKEIIEAFKNEDATVFQKHSRWEIWNLKLSGRLDVPKSMQTDFHLMVDSCKESL